MEKSRYKKRVEMERFILAMEALLFVLLSN